MVLPTPSDARTVSLSADPGHQCVKETDGSTATIPLQWARASSPSARPGLHLQLGRREACHRHRPPRPWPHGHIQALGTDASGRRRYRYRDAWREKRDKEQLERIMRLGQRLLPPAGGGRRPPVARRDAGGACPGHRRASARRGVDADRWRGVRPRERDLRRGHPSEESCPGRRKGHDFPFHGQGRSGPHSSGHRRAVGVQPSTL
jgi:hypothetical protein